MMYQESTEDVLKLPFAPVRLSNQNCCLIRTPMTGVLRLYSPPNRYITTRPPSCSKIHLAVTLVSQTESMPIPLLVHVFPIGKHKSFFCSSYFSLHKLLPKARVFSSVNVIVPNKSTLQFLQSTSDQRRNT
jgi:hypothetical protein